MSNRLQKITAIVLLVVLLIPEFVYALPGDPVFDVPNTFQQSVNTTQSLRQTVKDFKLDKLALRLSSQALNSMTTDILSWANGGFEGKPSFVSNRNQYFSNLALDSATLFADELSQAAKQADQDLAYNSNPALQQYSAICNLAHTRTQPLVDKIKKSVYDIVSNSSADTNVDSYVRDHFGYSDLQDYLDDAREREMTPDEREACRRMNSGNRSYAQGVAKFLGYAVQTASIPIATKLSKPNLEGLPQTVANNWQEFSDADFARGGWAAWDKMADLQNTQYGRQFLASQALQSKVETEIAKKTAELQQGSGFLDKGKCLSEKTLSDKTTICLEFEGTTPGSIVRNTVGEAVLAPLHRQIQNDEWGEVLYGALGRLVQGFTDLGLKSLNNSIDSGLTDWANRNQNPFETTKSNVISTFGQSQQLNTGSGLSTADEIVDIPQFLYGDPVISGYAPILDPKGNPITDPSGKPVQSVDKSKPIYVIERDAGGNIVYERDLITNNFLLDAQGNKIPKIKRTNGAIDLTLKLFDILVAQQQLISFELLRQVMDLDQVLPGPDFGWDRRVSDKIDQTNIDSRQGREFIRLTEDKVNAGMFGTVLNDPLDMTLHRVDAPDGIRDRYQSVYNAGYKSAEIREYFRNATYPFPIGIEAVNITNATTGIQNTFTPYIKTGSVNRGPTDGGVASGNILVIPANAVIKPGTYWVAYHNVYPGYWYNTSTQIYENVPNIPMAQQLRTFVDYAMDTYADAYSSSKRRQTELSSVQNQLVALESRYRALPKITTQSSQSDRDLRATQENQIAYEISLLRDRVPTLDEIQSEQTKLANFTADKTKIDDMIEVAGKQLLQPQYFRLLAKDSLQLLYCPLEDHRKINRMTDDQLRQLLADNGASPSLDRYLKVKRNNQLLTSIQLGGGSPIGLAIGIFGAKRRAQKASEAVEQNQPIPVRCYETSVTCAAVGTDDKSCGNSPRCTADGYGPKSDVPEIDGVSTSLWQLVDPAGGVDCQDIYRSSLSDYTDAVIKTY